MSKMHRAQRSVSTASRFRTDCFCRALNPLRLSSILIVSLGCSGAWSEDTPVVPNTASEKVNYSLGYAFGGRLAELERGGTTVELTAVLKGMLDALSGSESRLGPAEMQTALERPGQAAASADTDDDARGKPAGTERTARTGGFTDDYAALNARRSGVMTLASGVQYEVLKSGDGRHPEPDGKVDVSYQGSLTNGVVFDSTYDEGRPIELRMDQIAVPGLREALLLMKEGDKWRVVIPPRMGFARAGNNQLRRRDLIYEIELVSAEARPE